jgi:hypothetical protein
MEYATEAYVFSKCVLCYFVYTTDFMLIHFRHKSTTAKWKNSIDRKLHGWKCFLLNTSIFWDKMPSTDVSEERVTSIFRVKQ